MRRMIKWMPSDRARKYHDTLSKAAATRRREQDGRTVSEGTSLGRIALGTTPEDNLFDRDYDAATNPDARWTRFD